MQGRLFGKQWRVCLIGSVLCLLAALFAFEAKLAWFSPTDTPCAQISAVKLRPTEAPKLIAQVLAAPSVQRHFPAEPLAVAIALLAALVPLSFSGWVRDERKLQVPALFSPYLFQRPPPQF